MILLYSTDISKSIHSTQHRDAVHTNFSNEYILISTKRLMSLHYKAHIDKKIHKWWSKWSLQISKNGPILCKYIHKRKHEHHIQYANKSHSEYKADWSSSEVPHRFFFLTWKKRGEDGRRSCWRHHPTVMK